MKKFLTTLFATLAIVLIGGIAKASAATDPKPYFNYYNNVPNVGSEADFVKVSKAGANDFVNNVEACTDGQEVAVRLYIHNGAEPEFNAPNNTGPGVTKNARVAINVASTTKPGIITGKLTADNAANTGITDTATVTCAGQVMEMTYVPGSAVIKNAVQSYVPLSNDIFKDGGTPFGYTGQNGKLPGCWEYVTYVFAKVVVKKKPIVIPTDAICKLENGGFVVIDNKKRTVSGTIKPQLTNATVTKYIINWGDGTVTNNQSGTHSYATDGKFTIVATMDVRLNDGTPKTVGGAKSDCVTTVEFKPGQPPVVVVPPTTVVPPTVTRLAVTGPASIFSIFAATSLVGAVMHRIYTARKATQL